MASDLENDFLVLLYDVARHIRTHADQAARETGLTRAQWIILGRLKREPGLSQNELSDHGRAPRRPSGGTQPRRAPHRS
jgi:DNA-binding MarR family transcriptional regulator